MSWYMIVVVVMFSLVLFNTTKDYTCVLYDRCINFDFVVYSDVLVFYLFVVDRTIKLNQQ